MPMMPPRRCPTCRQLIVGRSLPDLHPAGGPAARVRSCPRVLRARWRKVRALKLEADPFCSVCLKAGRMTPATDVDHLERVDGPDDPRFLDWSLLDSKCHSCHSRRTAVEHSTFAHRDTNITATRRTPNRRRQISRVQNPEPGIAWPTLARGVKARRGTLRPAGSGHGRRGP